MIHDTLQASGKLLPLVSVIIPVYNTQDYVETCLKSVLHQTYPNFEVLCVDDGSTDRSSEIIRRLMFQDSRIRLIQISNHGQGYARNLAFTETKGEYILFLDADDYIEPATLDLAVTRGEEDQADLVVFDWRYYNPVARTSRYCNMDAFFDKRVLLGEECEALLGLSSMFTVNKLYRKSFLEKNHIVYGEGYLYEDNPFWTKVVMAASRVSLIHSPLYRITVHGESSTKTKVDTDIHATSFIKAVSASIEAVMAREKPVAPRSWNLLAIYFYQKFLYYYVKRTPRSLRKKFLREFVDLLAQIPLEDLHERAFLSFGIKHHVFSRRRYGLFWVMVCLAQRIKPKLISWGKEGKKFGKKVLSKGDKLFRKLLHRPMKSNPTSVYAQQYKLPLYEDVILFMGFDHRYTGNSRYLFESMLQCQNTRKKIFFATDDPLVPVENRLQPGGDQFYRFLARAKVVIFESWIPGWYQKREHSTWIQLWHGTPVKRMLFDSHEPHLIKKNPRHKIDKYRDMIRWDYLLVDNPNVKSYFYTSFLFPEERMLCSGYPRVKYLLSRRGDKEYCKRIKEFYGIPEEKKVVLYLPTWRDYNQQRSQADFDTSYIMDLGKLQQSLGDGYEIVYKDHVYLSKPENSHFKNYGGAETQELMLIADYLITDYSSAMFDACAIDVPVILYCNDFERNEQSRGVYPSIWKDLVDFVCTSEEEVVSMIREYPSLPALKRVKERYAYRGQEAESLEDFILKL